MSVSPLLKSTLEIGPLSYIANQLNFHTIKLQKIALHGLKISSPINKAGEISRSSRLISLIVRF